MGAPSPHLATAQDKEQSGPGSGWEIEAPRTHPSCSVQGRAHPGDSFLAPEHASLASVLSAVKWE